MKKEERLCWKFHQGKGSPNSFIIFLSVHPSIQPFIIFQPSSQSFIPPHPVHHPSIQNPPSIHSSIYPPIILPPSVQESSILPKAGWSGSFHQRSLEILAALPGSALTCCAMLGNQSKPSEPLFLRLQSVDNTSIQESVKWHSCHEAH